MKYVCSVCGFVFDEDEGDIENDIEPGTPWDEVPEDYVCPMCGVGKEYFEPEDELDYSMDDDE